jgi:molecular chaperone GrpE (heat shock protein)
MPVAKADTVESLADEVGAQLDNLGRALQVAKDSGTAGKLAEIVPLVSAEINSIAERLSKLPEPSTEVKQRIDAKMTERETEMQQTFGDLDEFMAGLQPEVKTAVEEALGAFLNAMSAVEDVFSKYFDVEQPETPTDLPPEPELDPPASDEPASDAPAPDVPDSDASE